MKELLKKSLCPFGVPFVVLALGTTVENPELMSPIKWDPSSTCNLVDGEVIPIPTLPGILRFDITNELVNRFEIVVLANTLEPDTLKEPVDTEAVYRVVNDILPVLRDTILH